MEGNVYQLVILGVSAFGLYRGFHRGLTRQICGLLGFGFGMVFSVLFAPQLAEKLEALSPVVTNYPFPPFLYSILATSIIYTGVYYAVKILTRAVRNALRVFHVGMFDKLLGAAFCLFKYLLALSLGLNLLICINPDSPMMKYTRSGDGNMIEGVLMIAPAVLDCVSVDDLSHALQLIDAKKISLNFNEEDDVINNIDHCLKKINVQIC